MLPPYPGWYRGVITKRWAVPREFDTLDQLPLNKFKMPPVFPYAVRTDHGVFPALKDDPDFVRGVAAKYNTGGPLRFAVGDVVECSIGPNEWMRGTVRELHIPSRGWGRGWDFEGNRLKGVVCDTMPYHVTPRRQKIRRRLQRPDQHRRSRRQRRLRSSHPSRLRADSRGERATRVNPPLSRTPPLFCQSKSKTQQGDNSSEFEPTIRILDLATPRERRTRASRRRHAVRRLFSHPLASTRARRRARARVETAIPRPRRLKLDRSLTSVRVIFRS